MAENALTERDQRKLKAFEHQISKGLGDIYQAFRQIHDQKLYLGSHESFADYCQEKWGIGKSRAYHVLKHVQILRLIEDKDSAIAETVLEAHTREVADLSPEEAADVIVTTAEKKGGKITAKDVKATRSGDPFDTEEDDPFGDGTVSPDDETEVEQDSDPRPPRSGKEKSGDSSKPDPEKEFAVQKLKAKKTAEALIRAFDDLNRLRKNPEWHETALFEAKSLLIKARDWK